ncbi:MAG: putative toxin-antitoxin system toxin component, PIN family, partial [Thermoanaerobaculia bacterium]
DLVRVVFDTNVVVSGVVAEGLCREIVESRLPDHEPVLSDRLWEELVGALREKFGLEPDDLPLLGLYRRLATWVEPSPFEAPVCRDPDDDWVLATALAGEAQAIVTGGEDLLALGQHRGVAILSPRRFLERLGDAK